ncbi:MAG: nucleotide sugar dehydrogenase [Acidobacteria bacterium]|nr:MAG: nucleotide sugar dehydrogenase [Acidobacteriota bacterium]
MESSSANAVRSPHGELEERIARRHATVATIGLGYVGLPLALAFAERGFPVLGFDVDGEKIAALKRGECYIRHLDGERVAPLVRAGRLDATADFRRLAEADAVLISVPTPLGSHHEPDLSYVDQTAEHVARHLRRGQLVVLESTTYPGTTEERLRPVLEAGGLSCGEDFFLAYSPEREDPGNPDFGTTDVPKVVGGADRRSGDLAEALYRQVFSSVVRVSSPRAAEACKLTENVFRAVNIALVNELKTVFEAMGIDVWEVLDAAATKPFGFMRFDPGPGWGGHCIPVDPFYLAWQARGHGMRARFIELAGEVNREMPAYVVGKLQRALNDRGRAVRGSRILLLGLAYKPDVDDPRESPAFEILSRLRDLGAEVLYHDPHIPHAPAMRSWPDLPPLDSVPLDAAVLGAVDAVVVVTHHRAVDYELVRAHAPLVVDARGVYRQSWPGLVRA